MVFASGGFGGDGECKCGGVGVSGDDDGVGDVVGRFGGDGGVCRERAVDAGRVVAFGVAVEEGWAVVAVDAQPAGVFGGVDVDDGGEVGCAAVGGDGDAGGWGEGGGHAGRLSCCGSDMFKYGRGLRH